MRTVIFGLLGAAILALAPVSNADPTDTPAPPPPTNGGQAYQDWPCGMSVGPGLNSPLPRVRYKPC